MTRVTVDAATRSRLHDLKGLLEVCDESGRTLGYFHPIATPCGPGTSPAQSPISEDELERRRQQRSGRPLAEILERLKRT